MAPSYDDLIGEAYVAGMKAALAGQPVSICPYYQNTQQTMAFSSGHRDQMQWDAARAEKHDPE